METDKNASTINTKAALIEKSFASLKEQIIIKSKEIVKLSDDRVKNKAKIRTL